MKRNPIIMHRMLVIGVIVLIIGLGIQPAFAVKFNTTDSKEDCSLCSKKVSIQSIGNTRKTICDILGILLLRLIIQDVMLANFIDDIEDTNPILWLISTAFCSIVFIRLLFIAFIGINFFNCEDYWVNPYLESYISKIVR